MLEGITNSFTVLSLKFDIVENTLIPELDENINTPLMSVC